MPLLHGTRQLYNLHCCGGPNMLWLYTIMIWAQMHQQPVFLQFFVANKDGCIIYDTTVHLPLIKVHVALSLIVGTNIRVYQKWYHVRGPNVSFFLTLKAQVLLVCMLTVYIALLLIFLYLHLNAAINHLSRHDIYPSRLMDMVCIFPHLL